MKTIAIDIDDVIADTHNAVIAWGNERSGRELSEADYIVKADYWGYYERVWAEHDLSHLDFNLFIKDLAVDQAHIPLLPGALYAVSELRKRFHVILVTSRNPVLKTATRRWLDENLGIDIDIYFAKGQDHDASSLTKGEICKNLGAWLLIDDSVEHVQSALDYGTEAILFGSYGWHSHLPKGAVNKQNWSDILEYVNDHAK